MMTTKPRLLPLALAGLLSLPLAAAAQAQARDEHSAHHPESSQAVMPAEMASVQDLRQAMRARMAEIRATQDPERRRQLLEAQMKDMETMLEAGACPMPGGGMMGGRGGQGMMGGGMMGPGMMGGGMMGGGMQHGMGSQGTQGGTGCGMMGRGMQHGMGGRGRAGADDATLRRLEALEKRVDLIQTILQMQARQGDRD
jgi:hypothetical protein